MNLYDQDKDNGQTEPLRQGDIIWRNGRAFKCSGYIVWPEGWRGNDDHWGRFDTILDAEAFRDVARKLTDLQVYVTVDLESLNQM